MARIVCGNFDEVVRSPEFRAFSSRFGVEATEETQSITIRIARREVMSVTHTYVASEDVVERGKRYDAMEAEENAREAARREASLDARQARIDEYRRQHACCPQCGNVHIETTCMGYLWIDDAIKDGNRATCHKCKWVGIVHDMVPNKEGS